MYNRKKEIETNLHLLSKIEVIKNDIWRNKNTSNVRRDFGYFVIENGLPYMMILDYLIDFGLPKKDDPDKRKLVRTFLLAYTILAVTKGFDGGSANVVFIIDIGFTQAVSEFINNPSQLLKQLRTRDDRINSIIDTFTNDSERVKNFFRIAYIYRPDDKNYAQEIKKLEKIMDLFDQVLTSKPDRKIKKSEPGVEKPEVQVIKPDVPIIKDNLEPADVVCRAVKEKIIVNGKLRQITDQEKRRYIEKNIHLNGALTTVTLPTVQERILTTFMAMNSINPIKKDEKIFIFVSDTSLIDGSFAGSMGTFLTKTLSGYEGISLDIGIQNNEKIKKSTGYVAIKEFIIKNL
jgi:hypothetical protein